MRTFVGVVAALVAVFAGGCGVVFFVIGIGAAIAGETNYGSLLFLIAVGIVTALIAGLIAWWALIKRRDGITTDQHLE